jgi:beta-lactamase class A
MPGSLLTRREVLAGGAALVAGAMMPRALGGQGGSERAFAPAAAIEASVGGRLGVAALDTATSERLTHRADERFPMCSTFKWLLAAQVLARVDAGEESLDRVVRYGPADLLEYAPVTRERVEGGGLTIYELCAAAVQVSDNTAANLLLATVDGPEGFTAFLRALGDPTTRLDRREPELNEATPGDPRDTTTPAAMLDDLRTVLLGEVLSPASRERLIDWMETSTTGKTRLRAGLPGDWRVGDKTGTCGPGFTNDVAIAWPPGRSPILIAAYLAEAEASFEDCSAALAEVGRGVAEAFA